MKRHVYRAVELKGIISKKRILKELGSELEKMFIITRKGMKYFIGIFVDDMYNINAGECDSHQDLVWSEEYEDLGTF